MRIIILGSNQVSETLAQTLVNEDNDVVVISTNTARLRELQNRLDIQTIEGYGSYPDILEQAQARDTEMLIAVSDNDEVNMLACQVAYSLFHIPIKIARIRTQNYMTHKDLFCNENLPVDVIISPEQLITDHISRLINCPGAMQVLDFAEGKVQLVSVRPSFGGVLVGKTVANLKSQLDLLDANLVAIFRGNQLIPIKGETVIDVGDEVFFISLTSQVRSITALFKRIEHDNKLIMIAGGGHIGSRLASELENNFSVKLLECDLDRAQQLSIDLHKTTVLHGDASDKDLLVNEKIENVDVFCSLTNDDEANIMSSLQAKRLGAKQVMSLVTKSAYVDIIDNNTIDFVISPQNTTLSSILTYLRKGDIVTAHSLRQGAAEAIEMIAHGDDQTSRVVGKTLDQLGLPEDVSVSAIVRDGKMVKLTEETLINSQDHVILFVANKKHLKEVEKLFQVKVNFI